MNKRIVEEINSDGVSRFYPERKVFFGMFWWRYDIHEGFDSVNFDTYKEAKEWHCC